MKKTQLLISSAATATAVALFSGCAAVPIASAVIGAAHGVSAMNQQRKMSSDADLIAERQKISARFNGNPDTDAWYEGRQGISQALGDRDFDQDFGRVFDSLMVAVATLELRVNNMERQSGYIAAAGIALPPADAKAMRHEAVTEWCSLNGFDPAVLDRPLQTEQMQQMADMVDFNAMMARYEKTQKGLTFQLIKMGDAQTRVKLRFSEVYYPGELESYYKLVWQAVDKQVFMDDTIEGAVEDRE